MSPYEIYPCLWDWPGCAEPLSTLQDYIFYLEPERLESGKGKCPYDPKLDTASALISECLHPTPVLWGQYVAFATRRQSVGVTNTPELTLSENMTLFH